ncbi:benzoyl-CoA 2,3-epoxidase subunit BoxA [Hydrogenophaga sp. OTU3427]|uniref:benzoyl-CoA 2,3-epoxidase subunit BoxA n=1 Tax=Hydrogenophaga sp. OTU3427 TaxID=3043856 RepID=UPI00313CC0B6
MDATVTNLLKQHLIDPEICIRCNTCEAICPVQAITHDSRNYVVDIDKCNWCNDCISPCPTGAIDNARLVKREAAYTLEEQCSWDTLPGESDLSERLSQYELEVPQASSVTASSLPIQNPSSQVPPWSAATPYTNLYGPKAPNKSITATVVGNVRVTEVTKGDGQDYDTHHLVLDFGAAPFPVLEGQSIGVIPPGLNDIGRPHHPRQYSVASPRNGERPGYNNLSLTIKRVLEDHTGQRVRGIASNFMCDLKVGDKVEVIGPFGSTFLMPNHPSSSIVMICTGTGSAPMRAMTEWRRRLTKSGEQKHSGRLMLFFGARTQEELPYFGPLTNLPKDFIDINLAFSRVPGEPKTYVQDLMRQRAADLLGCLLDPNCYFFVCGLKSMEEGVLQALQDIAQTAGLEWTAIASKLKQLGRLHLETY